MDDIPDCHILDYFERFVILFITEGEFLLRLFYVLDVSFTRIYSNNHRIFSSASHLNCVTC